jgi:hypothetical protein
VDLALGHHLFDPLHLRIVEKDHGVARHLHFALRRHDAAAIRDAVLFAIHHHDIRGDEDGLLLVKIENADALFLVDLPLITLLFDAFR